METGIHARHRGHRRAAQGLLRPLPEVGHALRGGPKKPIKLQDVIHLIYDMRAYAFRHFYTEETLLLKYRYPKIYGHISQHDLFLRSLQEFTAKLHAELAKSEAAGQEGFLACASHINDYLTNWWGEHILNIDQDYARFIRERKGHKA